MNCEDCQQAFGDLVDGAPLDEAKRIEVEAHLRDCQSCRGILADLRQVHRAATRLPLEPVPARVWSQLSTRLPGRQASPIHAAIRALFGTPRMRLAWGAAGTLALAVIVLLVVLPGQPPRQAAVAPKAAPAVPGPGAVHPTDTELVQSVESELRLAEQHYEKAIAGLEQIAKAGEGSLDPRVASTLRKNLGVIDQAIHESRVALDAQPTNELARESLFEAFRRKVGVLQDTVSLINEMRKGNEAQATKIIGNMNKS